CPSVCLPSCTRDGDCPVTHECVRSGEEAGSCQRLPCRLDVSGAQSSDRPGDARGRVLSRCANGVSPSDPTCEPLRCPGTSYCAAHDVTTDQGACELPMPVMLSPFLIEVFNSSVASSLGFQPLDGVDALLGARFRVHLGGSYFSDSLPRKQQVVKTAEVVGFSSKALDFGLTLPLEAVRDLNTRFKGRDAARSYNTFILETSTNEDVSGLINELEARGFALSRKSQDARKAADLLFILTVVFGLISTVIMGVAAISIAHTFLMMVSERRHEIGLMRALGATRGDIRILVLAEAAAVGLFGALTGEVVSYGLSRLANLAADRLLERVPFRPDDLFQYDWRILVGAVIFAIVFAVLGALTPARRAARLDPARVLVG
ncbi:MAG: ABC transporter permease, partial [Myxococcota bacterium]|nr:ABC transporter permease [Myxococcota bacterium]